MLIIRDPKPEIRETHDVALLLREPATGNHSGLLLFSDLSDFDRFVADIVRIHSQISLTNGYAQTASSNLSVHTDGASRSNPGPGACAYVVARDGQSGLTTYKQYLGPRVTNNMAEYQGMARALAYLASLCSSPANQAPCTITIHSDSRLVVEQVNGNWRAKDADLKVLCSECQLYLRSLRARGHRVTLQWIPTEESFVADRLCNEALNEAPVSPACTSTAGSL
jgi:ribonuclease HI